MLVEVWFSVVLLNFIDLERIEGDMVVFSVFEVFNSNIFISLDVLLLIDNFIFDIELFVMGDLLRWLNNIDGMIIVYNVYKKNNFNVLNINLLLV